MDNNERSVLSEVVNKETTTILPGIGYLLRKAWDKYAKHFGLFIGIMALPIILTFCYQFMIVFRVVIRQWFLGVMPHVGGVMPSLLLLVLFVIQVISILWGQSSIIILVRDAAENIGIKEALKRGWKLLPSYIVVLILRSFFLLGGFSLLLIPGIIFSFWSMFAVYVLVVDNVKGTNALLKSREYVRGQFWPLLWRIFLVLLPLFALIIPVQLYLNFRGNSLAAQVIASLVTFFVSPFFLVYFFELFMEVKKIKGDVAVHTTAGKKAVFIGVGCCGCLLPLIGFVLTFIVALVGMNSTNALSHQQASDIKQIQSDLLLFYKSQGKYPDSLAELSTIAVSVPFDPATNQPYQYYVEAQKQNYKICGLVRSTKKQVCVSYSSLDNQ